MKKVAYPFFAIALCIGTASLIVGQGSSALLAQAYAPNEVNPIGSPEFHAALVKAISLADQGQLASLKSKPIEGDEHGWFADFMLYAGRCTLDDDPDLTSTIVMQCSISGQRHQADFTDIFAQVIREVEGAGSLTPDTHRRAADGEKYYKSAAGSSITVSTLRTGVSVSFESAYHRR